MTSKQHPSKRHRHQAADEIQNIRIPTNQSPHHDIRQEQQQLIQVAVSEAVDSTDGIASPVAFNTTGGDSLNSRNGFTSGMNAVCLIRSLH
jgi:hypothetical protein